MFMKWEFVWAWFVLKLEEYCNCDFLELIVANSFEVYVELVEWFVKSLFYFLEQDQMVMVKVYFEFVFCEYLGVYILEEDWYFFWIMVYYDLCFFYFYFYYWFELACMDNEFYFNEI